MHSAQCTQCIRYPSTPSALLVQGGCYIIVQYLTFHAQPRHVLQGSRQRATTMAGEETLMPGSTPVGDYPDDNKARGDAGRRLP